MTSPREQLDIAKQLRDLVETDSDEFRFSDRQVIDSVEKQTRAGQGLSPKQVDVISKLWDKVFIGRGRS